MNDDKQAELDELNSLFTDAWNAEIPDLNEIRRCREAVMHCRASISLDHMSDGIEVPTPGLSLKIIRNEEPELTTRRGPSSPIKTPEICEFEATAKRVFGSLVACSTYWRQIVDD